MSCTLGFLIGFLAQWIAGDDFVLSGSSDVPVFVGCIAGAGLLLHVLFGMLAQPLAETGPLPGDRAILRQYRRRYRFP